MEEYAVMAEGEQLHDVRTEGGQEGRGARQGLRAGSRARERRGLWDTTFVSLSHIARQHPRWGGAGNAGGSLLEAIALLLHHGLPCHRSKGIDTVL